MSRHESCTYAAGWFGAADLQKAFGKEAQSQGVQAAAKKAAVIWATGIPVSALRDPCRALKTVSTILVGAPAKTLIQTAQRLFIL